MAEDELTTIQLKTSTREKLKLLGAKDETYDAIILKLMERRRVKKNGDLVER